MIVDETHSLQLFEERRRVDIDVFGRIFCPEGAALEMRTENQRVTSCHIQDSQSFLKGRAERLLHILGYHSFSNLSTMQTHVESHCSLL